MSTEIAEGVAGGASVDNSDADKAEDQPGGPAFRVNRLGGGSSVPGSGWFMYPRNHNLRILPNLLVPGWRSSGPRGQVRQPGWSHELMADYRDNSRPATD